MGELPASIEEELRLSIQDSIVKRRKYHDMSNAVMTDADYAEAAMRAFVDVIYSPLTIERAAQQYAKDQQIRWHDLTPGMQVMIRVRALNILKEVLRDPTEES